MKRSHFLASIFGLVGLGAKAQQWRQAAETECKVSPDHLSIECNPDWAKTKPALNGQCPVCGTMAEAYRPLPAYDTVCSGPDGYVPCPHPKERDVRCKRCNVKFAQDTEPR
jgi:hypothetical protein